MPINKPDCFVASLLAMTGLDFFSTLLEILARAILQRLSQMRGRDIFSGREIADRARHFQHAVESAGRELQLLHGRAHQRGAGVVEAAVAAHVAGAHFRIAREAAPGEPLAGPRPGGFHAGAHSR